MHTNPCRVFAKPPLLPLEPEESVCTCGKELLVQKSRVRKITTLHIGQFFARETILYCPACERFFSCKMLHSFVAPGCNFGYDVIEYIGTEIWRHSKTIREVQDELKNKNIVISEREIAYLAKKFILYVAEAHKDQQDAINDFLRSRGGYFLHFDSTHPGTGSSHLMCAVAEEASEKSSIVLGSAKLPRECKETVTAFLRTIKQKYGDPLAGVSDMLASNLSAFKEVFPEALLLICHFHFLRDLGKDLFGYENQRLEGILSSYDINQRLKDFIKDCKRQIEQDPSLSKYLEWQDEGHSFLSGLPDVVIAYILSLWILEYKQDLHGYGFPFDRATFSYLQRIKQVEELLSGFEKKGKKTEELFFMLLTVLQEEYFLKHMSVMERKVNDFERIRSIMKIAPFFKGKGLNDDGAECDMTLMQSELKKFLCSDEMTTNKDSGYQKMKKQFRKYWGMLFAEAFEVELPTRGKVFVHPQRTNNLMERFFRDFLRAEQKRTGMDTLSRRTQAMIAETPMVKNLENPDFIQVLLKGEASLAARFAKLDASRIRQGLKDASGQEKLPSRLQKFLENPSFCKTFKVRFSCHKTAA